MSTPFPYNPDQNNEPYIPGSASSSSMGDKNWSMISHVVPLAAMWLSAGTLGFIASIVIHLMSKDQGEFRRNYSAQALNVQLNALLWFIISWMLVFVLIGFIMLPIVAVWATVLHIVAIMKANQGVIWKPPFCIKFIH